MKKWVVSKIVAAKTLKAALKKEKETEPTSVRLVVTESDKLEDAIGFHADIPDDTEDDY